MAALTADARRQKQGDGRVLDAPVAASTTIFEGAMVMANSSGFAVPASDAAGGRFLGFARKKVVNTGANGAKRVNLEMGQLERVVAGTGMSQATVGLNVFVADDQTVTNAATAANDVKVGKAEKFETGFIWFRAGVFGPTDS